MFDSFSQRSSKYLSPKCWVCNSLHEANHKESSAVNWFPQQIQNQLKLQCQCSKSWKNHKKTNNTKLTVRTVKYTWERPQLLMSSKTTTPKLNTSIFSVSSPSPSDSGAMYTLHLKSNQNINSFMFELQMWCLEFGITNGGHKNIFAEQFRLGLRVYLVPGMFLWGWFWLCREKLQANSKFAILGL